MVPISFTLNTLLTLNTKTGSGRRGTGPWAHRPSSGGSVRHSVRTSLKLWLRFCGFSMQKKKNHRELIVCPSAGKFNISMVQSASVIVLRHCSFFSRGTAVIWDEICHFSVRTDLPFTSVGSGLIPSHQTGEVAACCSSSL